MVTSLPGVSSKQTCHFLWVSADLSAPEVTTMLSDGFLHSPTSARPSVLKPTCGKALTHFPEPEQCSGFFLDEQTLRTPPLIKFTGRDGDHRTYQRRPGAPISSLPLMGGECWVDSVAQTVWGFEIFV